MNSLPRTIARVGQFAYAQAWHQAMINRWIYTSLAVLGCITLLVATQTLRRRMSRPETARDNDLLWVGVFIAAFALASFGIAALLYWIDPQWQAVNMLIPGNG